jgi:hypothetical protein
MGETQGYERMSNRGSVLHAVPDDEDYALCGKSKEELRPPSNFERVRCVDCAARAGERGWPNPF